MRDDDVFIMQDTGKFVVQDLEGRANTKDDKKKSRKKEGYGVDSDTDSDDEHAVVKTKKGAAAPSSAALRKLIKEAKGSSAVALLRS
mgnify:CR=1 FL=1